VSSDDAVERIFDEFSGVGRRGGPMRDPMCPTAKPEPASAGGVLVRLQPDNKDLGEGHDDLPADDHLDRLLGDSDMLYRLQLSGYARAEWDKVAAEFARYGMGVLSGWLRNGRIYPEVMKKTGRQVPRPEDRLDDEAVSDLASETIIRALDAFLVQVLQANKWDPARGASLKTFFIGQCMFQFSNVMRDWRKADRRRRFVQLVPDAAQLGHQGGQAEGAEAEVVRHITATEALDGLTTAKARRALALAAVGYTYAEIAAEIGVADDKSVENLVGYQARLARGRSQRGEQAG